MRSGSFRGLIRFEGWHRLVTHRGRDDGGRLFGDVGLCRAEVLPSRVSNTGDGWMSHVILFQLVLEFAQPFSGWRFQHLVWKAHLLRKLVVVCRDLAVKTEFPVI